MENKTTPKWAWPGSRDQMSKFREPLITFEWKEWSSSNLVQRWTTHPGLASCSSEYCNRSCLWVCDSGRAVSEPYYSQCARSVWISLSVFFFISIVTSDIFILQNFSSSFYLPDFCLTDQIPLTFQVSPTHRSPGIKLVCDPDRPEDHLHY